MTVFEDQVQQRPTALKMVTCTCCVLSKPGPGDLQCSLKWQYFPVAVTPGTIVGV